MIQHYRAFADNVQYIQILQHYLYYTTSSTVVVQGCGCSVNKTVTGNPGEMIRSRHLITQVIFELVTISFLIVYFPDFVNISRKYVSAETHIFIINNIFSGTPLFRLCEDAIELGSE